MNKGELINTLREEADITKSNAELVVSTFFNEITSALERRKRVEIRGFCSFFVKKYKGYQGRNPKTGEPVPIKPKNLPFFKCGKELKEMVDKDHLTQANQATPQSLSNSVLSEKDEAFDSRDGKKGWV